MFIRRTQLVGYSGFVEMSNCLTVLESNFGGNDCTYSIKSAFEKAAPPPPWHPDVPAPLYSLHTY